MVKIKKKDVSEVNEPVSNRSRSPSRLSQIIDRTFSFLHLKTPPEEVSDERTRSIFYTRGSKLNRSHWDAILEPGETGIIQPMGADDLAFIATGLKEQEEPPRDKFGFSEQPHLDGLFFYTLIERDETYALYSSNKIQPDSDIVYEHAQHPDPVLIEMPSFPTFNIDYADIKIQMLERKCNHYRNMTKLLSEQSQTHLKATRRFKRELSQKEKENRKLKKQNHLDEMTGLRNQRALSKDKAAHIRHSLSSGSLLYIAFGDIEKFKRYNSKFGHQFGDKVMKGIGSVVNDATRRNGEYAYRRGSSGADEIVFVFRDKTPVNAAQSMAHIKRNVHSLRLTPEQGLLDSGETYIGEEEIITVYMDVGLEVFDPQSLIDKERPNIYATDNDWYRAEFDKVAKVAREVANSNKLSDLKKDPLYQLTYEELMTDSGEDLMTGSGEDLIEEDLLTVN